MVDSVVNGLNWLSPELVVLLVAMLPVFELRGAIPIGMALGLPVWQSFLLAVLGNGLITVLLLLIIPKFFAFFMRFPKIKPHLEKFFNKTREKGKQLNKKGAVGLMLFVGVPLPGTGVWTGCFLAYLMGMKFSTALISVLLGMVLAGVLMTLGSLGLLTVVGDIEAVLVILLVLLVLAYIINKVRAKRHK